MTTRNARSIEAVLAHHNQAFLARDLDAIMQDYTNDSVVFTPNAAEKGLESIRAAFTRFLGRFAPEVLKNMKVARQDIAGEYAYVLWSAPPAVISGGDTFHIRNGKILGQSFVGQFGP
jgi:ketosteroid isomerase-like protein